MLKRCPHCGFKNPSDVGDCLYCHQDLPETVAEAKEAWKTLENAAEGRWGEVGRKLGEDVVAGQVSSLKYRFHPVWFVKVRLYRLKQAFITLIWVFGIIAFLIVLGLIFKAVGGK